MTDDRDTPRPRRRLQLSRETLRDLTPGAADAAAVEGGATLNEPRCANHVILKADRFTGAIPGPTDILDIHTTTAQLVGPDGQLKPGHYVVEKRIVTEIDVLDTGEVSIPSVQIRDLDPKERG